MQLEVTLSQQAAKWLEQRAQAAGTDEATIVATVLNQLAAQELGTNGAAGNQRLAAFDRWVASLPPRPGPSVDASRESIYD